MNGAQGPRSTAQGTTGPQGPTGAKGAAAGTQGPCGNQGTTGPQGPTGAKGAAAGKQGPRSATQGTTGPQGPTGAKGAAAGTQGPRGSQGTTGPQGPTGAKGAAAGTQGPRSATQGTTGPQGPTGAKGAAAGTQGPRGSQGTTGPQGPTGAIGKNGTQGPAGLQGTTGAAGAIGTSGTLINLTRSDSQAYLIGKSEYTDGWNADLYVSSAYSQNGVLYQGSDERRKRFLDDIEIDFNGLKAIPKKYYVWKNQTNGNVQIGTSAQKLAEIFPNAVCIDKEGYYSVAYDRLAIIALAAIDKLHDENVELKNKIDELEKRISE